jgi:hypothetical protein
MKMKSTKDFLRHPLSKKALHLSQACSHDALKLDSATTATAKRCCLMFVRLMMAAWARLLMVHLLWTHAGLECRAGAGPILDSTHHRARSKPDLRGNDGVGCARDKRSTAKKRKHSLALLQMWPLLLLLLLMLRCACCASAASAGIVPLLTPAATPRQHPHLTLCCCCWTQTFTVPRQLVTPLIQSRSYAGLGLTSSPWAQKSYV